MMNFFYCTLVIAACLAAGGLFAISRTLERIEKHLEKIANNREA